MKDFFFCVLILSRCVHILMRFQGDANCRRSALLKDDNLLDFYYEDTKTVYDMFQRGLRIAGKCDEEQPGCTLSTVKTAALV